MFGISFKKLFINIYKIYSGIKLVNESENFIPKYGGGKNIFLKMRFP